MPFSTIAYKIKEHGFKRGLIIASDKVTAGNLKLYFSKSDVIFSDMYKWRIPLPKDQDILFIFGDQQRTNFKYKQFKKFIKTLHLQQYFSLPIHKVRANYNYSGKQVTVLFMWKKTDR